MFPAVTFCNFNFFNTDAGKQFLNRTLTEFANSDIYTANKATFAKSKIKLYQINLKYAKSSMYKNKTVYNNKSLLQSFGMTLQDMMLSCYFGSQTCNYTDFEYYFDVNYGNCYKFNTGLNGFNQSVPVQQVITPGDTSGLQLGLSVGQEQLTDKITYSSGIYLAIHNDSFKSLLPTNGFNLPTGRETRIGINHFKE